MQPLRAVRRQSFCTPVRLAGRSAGPPPWLATFVLLPPDTLILRTSLIATRPPVSNVGFIEMSEKMLKNVERLMKTPGALRRRTERGNDS